MRCEVLEGDRFGHKRADRPDSPAKLAETRRYIEDFERVATTTTTTLELYHGMLALHPHPDQPRRPLGLRPFGRRLAVMPGLAADENRSKPTEENPCRSR
ncbi:MAG: fold metallo-hydrolase [Mycobacterium sp.]|jgi:hypothetical protein|nr:fold metallo-hydrolase [Mycobacterium sp.]